jgi:asparagine synthase (glutamine-hydrolysing)
MLSAHDRKTFSSVANGVSDSFLGNLLAPRLLDRARVGGIIGKLSFEPDETLARPVLEQMHDTVAHRHAKGPRQIYVAPGIALGSSTVAAGATTRVVADAQLANARELRGELQRRGRHLPTANDAELIAHAFEVWGTGCFARLDGPFACAVWDERDRRLVLARDPLGIRSLYFALLHGHGVVFASDVKALFQDPGVTREYCPAAIDAYLTLGYVPAPLTAFRRVSKVEPAQAVIIEGRRLHAEQYWDLPLCHGSTTIDDTIRRLEGELRIAMRGDHADQGRAVLFSGGVASAALLWAAPPTTGPVVTVALDQESAALASTDAAARLLNRALEIEVATVDTSVLAAELAAHLDEPMADPSALAQYVTYVAARLHGDRAVSGLGAAALLGDAPRHTVWDGEHRRAIYTRAFAWEVRDINPRSRYQELCDARVTDDPLERSMYVQVRSVLAESTLRMADRASLAAGLDLRFPYLNRRFVEFAASIPSFVKSAGAGPMPLLRRMLAATLSADLLPAPHIHAVPRWLHDALPTMVPSMLLAPRFDGRGIISRPALRALWDEHCRGRRDHALRFWSLLMLELWFREFIDDDAVRQPLEYALLRAA